MKPTYKIKGKHVLITGAAFIGVHLIDKLIREDVASISIVNKTSRHKKHIHNIRDIQFHTADLRDWQSAKKAIKNKDVVIHLAADHGGRGYVDLKQGNTASNFLLDGAVFKASLDLGVEKVFFASSGCVYPNFKQTDLGKKIYLKESDVVPPYDADNTYGWAKLMGELTLKQYYKDFGLRSAIGRFFTVYGPYASESHAVMGTIAKAYTRQDPFEVWGNGKQIRNWTYVDDIASGIVSLIKHVDDATAINLGTEERVTVDMMVKMVLLHFDFHPTVRHVAMPTGPLNRVASGALAYKRLSWKPQYSFKRGLEETIEWYRKNKNKKLIATRLESLLLHD